MAKKVAKTPERYDHSKVEKKWQSLWNKKSVYKVVEDKKKPKYYVLDMFPYPSGQGLHVGHPRGYIASDVYARFMRMQGYNVLHPMGFDAFGLPAEQYAIEHKVQPAKAVAKNAATYKKQLDIIGFSYDWTRSVNTTDPKYYKWTQWIFLKLYESWYDEAKKKARPITELIKIFAKQGSTDFSAAEWKNFSELEKQNVLMQYRLAYEGYSEVNWCPQLGTVLANDEIVDGPDGRPVSERGGYPVEKKSLRQWFLRITAYADRLLSGLEKLDWPEHLKEIERNWIGKSEGAEIEFALKNRDEKIKVFTTRADTLFGVTYVVLAPESPLVQKLLSSLSNKVEVEMYIQEVRNKTDQDRTENKEKTGVELKGVKAINPANGEEVPVWIADYVLATYGTGMVMAVPAHDERDFAFAKKYNLPIKEVVIPKTFDHNNPPQAGKQTVERRAIQAIIVNPQNKKILCLKWKKFPWTTFVTGGIEGNEDIVKAAEREVREETGYTDLKYIRTLGGPVESHFYASHKGENRKALFSALVFELVTDEKKEIASEENEIHEIHWVSWNEMTNDKNLCCSEYKIWLDRFFNPEHAYSEGGVLIDSENFTGLTSEEARKKITAKVGGKIVTKFKMRDAVFARQRYWGEPIPLIHEKDGMIDEVAEKKLPLKLPNVKSYQPIGTGESPLAGVRDWVKHGYETNTMPGWAGSSWYFLRYMDPKNSKQLVGTKAVKYWKQVDMYVGGAEHATGHLLYARFWNKFLFDLGLVVSDEPFKALRNQGMVLGSDSRKMSKRWGNVVNPDEVVKNVGADTLRVYESFMGPFEQEIPWSTDSMVGSRRFLDKVWNLQEKVSASAKDSEKVTLLLNQTMKKVEGDIKSFSANTAISSMMILVNAFDEQPQLSKQAYISFLKILSPFAPHISAELYAKQGSKGMLVSEKWPAYNKKVLQTARVNMIVQVNGRVRATFEVAPDASEAEVEKLAMANQDVVKWFEGKQIIKQVFIKNKIINFVVG